MSPRFRFLSWNVPTSGSVNEPDEVAAASVRLVFPSSPQFHHHNCGRLAVLGCTQDAELLQRSRAVVQPDFLGDLAILHTQHGRSCEVHFPARGRRKRADQKVAEGGPGVRATPFPAADDIVTLGDEVCRAPKAEVRECPAEFGHELLHVLATATRRMQRILQENVGRAELIDDAGVPGVAPKLLEPSSNDGFVVLLLRHGELLLTFAVCWPLGAADRIVRGPGPPDSSSNRPNEIRGSPAGACNRRESEQCTSQDSSFPYPRTRRRPIASGRRTGLSSSRNMDASRSSSPGRITSPTASTPTSAARSMRRPARRSCSRGKCGPTRRAAMLP